MIGFCSIYLVKDEAGLMLNKIHMDRIKQHTKQDFTIFAICLDGCRPTIEAIAPAGTVFIDQPENLPETTSLQHTAMLDLLVEAAIGSGCSHVVALDNDAWPLRDNWIRFYQERLTTKNPVAAIARTEIGDNFPLAAFTMFEADFWNENSSFGSRLVGGDMPTAVRDIATRPKETGSGILTQLRRQHRGYLRLEKTNQWEPHYVMAAVYDDAVFHFGSGSRNPWFVWDHQMYHTDRNPLAVEFARAANDGIRGALLEILGTSPDDFFATLRGPDERHFEPVATYAPGLPQTLGRIPIGRRKVWRQDHDC